MSSGTRCPGRELRAASVRALTVSGQIVEPSTERRRKGFSRESARVIPTQSKHRHRDVGNSLIFLARALDGLWISIVFVSLMTRDGCHTYQSSIKLFARTPIRAKLARKLGETSYRYERTIGLRAIASLTQPLWISKDHLTPAPDNQENAYVTVAVLLCVGMTLALSR